MRVGMRIGIEYIFSLVSVMVALAVAEPLASAQTAAAEKHSRAEFAVDYNFLHSNAPPGGCTCFNLNGGNATFAWPVKAGHFAFVGDVGVGHNNGISSSGYTLTLSTYTGGFRYKPLLGSRSVQPFGQVLVGVAHSNGSLVQGATPAAANAGAAFAAIAGGGVDLRVGERVSIRLVEADYLATTFDNGVNDHQNILRIGAGVVLHF